MKKNGIAAGRLARKTSQKLAIAPIRSSRFIRFGGIVPDRKRSTMRW